MFRKILLPLDGSRLSEGIIPYVAQLANGLNARRVTVLYVAPPAGAGARTTPTVTRVPDGGVVSAKAYVQEAEEKLRGLGITQVNSQVLTGTAASEIVRLAEGSDYNLVAMATHGRSGLGRWVFGSTTDKVLHSTVLPMLLIRPRGPGQGPAPPPPTTTLVVPLDGSTLAEAVLPAAQNIAKKVNLQVAVLRVVPSIGMLYAGIEPYAYDLTLDKDVEKLAGQYLRNVTEDLRRLGIQASGYQTRGDAAGEIIAFSEETPGSLVVMSTHGRSGVGRWLLGSVADRVVRTSSQPVLLIRAKAVAGSEPPV